MALSDSTSKSESSVTLVPDYNLQESSSQLILSVHAPLCGPSNISVFLEKNVVIFEGYPYFLRLKLPCNISNESHEEGFEVFEENKTYILTLRKEVNIDEEYTTENENNSTIGSVSQSNFEKETGNTLHRNLDSSKCLTNITAAGILSSITLRIWRPHSEESKFLHRVLQAHSSANMMFICFYFIINITDLGKPFYGFANIFSGKFSFFYKEFSNVINLEDPDNTKEEERTCLRQKEEEEKWSEDHYLADFVEDEHIKPLLKYIPQWCLSKIRDLNHDEQEILESIPKIKCLQTHLSDDQRKLAEFQMVDILLCYCYNKRTTEGDNSVESAWTINKLSSSLSWFEVFRDLRSVLLSFYKRSLIYPLYRHWELTKVVHKDVITLLKLGSSQVTRCFIEIRELFSETEHCYILNTLFIDPFCHFSNALNRENLSELADKIEMIDIQKEEVHEDLLILELAAKVTLEEEELSRENGRQINEITQKMSAINVDGSENTSSSDGEDDVSTSESYSCHPKSRFSCK